MCLNGGRSSICRASGFGWWGIHYSLEANYELVSCPSPDLTEEGSVCYSFKRIANEPTITGQPQRCSMVIKGEYLNGFPKTSVHPLEQASVGASIVRQLTIQATCYQEVPAGSKNKG